MTSLYLTTTAERAEFYLEHRNNAAAAAGDWPADLPPTVILTDRPVDFRYGMAGEVIFAVQLRRSETIKRYERKSAAKPFREWVMPVGVFLRILRTMHMV
jgi:hypothetical protein